eukprot:7390651-Prymnesium_polylepis.1
MRSRRSRRTRLSKAAPLVHTRETRTQSARTRSCRAPFPLPPLRQRSTSPRPQLHQDDTGRADRGGCGGAEGRQRAGARAGTVCLVGIGGRGCERVRWRPSGLPREHASLAVCGGLAMDRALSPRRGNLRLKLKCDEMQAKLDEANKKLEELQGGEES